MNELCSALVTNHTLNTLIFCRISPDVQGQYELFQSLIESNAKYYLSMNQFGRENLEKYDIYIEFYYWITRGHHLPKEMGEYLMQTIFLISNTFQLDKIKKNLAIKFQLNVDVCDLLKKSLPGYSEKK
eukprot:TRINITY_DN18342_c0_g1_i1.p1 TRINITY_DN18342_c0_g1~~TRINITY_DN18342_c0_g1_i1.p1  ORF type:complete len:128 (-),score=33.23 TRINITY_DN18342_c0_g1_i1:98-481(-)